MFQIKWQTDQGLWQSVLTLVRGQHYTDAIEVMKAIVVQTVQSIGGSTSYLAFPTPQKRLEEKEILYMQSLSKEIAQLVQQRKKDRAAELTAEYLNHFVHLLSDTEQDEIYLHKQLLKGFIDSKIAESSGNEYKVVKSDEIFEKSTNLLSLATLKPEKVEYVTSSEAAEIGGVSDQTIRRWCEKGKFPEAYKTDGGHWRIPGKYLKMTLHEARKADATMKKVDQDTRERLGGDVDEFNLDLDYS